MLNIDNLKKAINDMQPKSKKFNFYKYPDNVINGPHKVQWFLNCATRSNGKTTAVQRDIILTRLARGEKSIILKHRKEFLKNQYNTSWWTDIVKQCLRKWDIHIEYKSGVYYINEYDKFVDGEGVFDRKEWFKSATKFAYVIPLMQEEQYKSVVETENTTSIVYDEFARTSGSLPQEVERMKSLISTVVRTSGDVQVFMNANIVEPHNPFFMEFGINAYTLEEGKSYTYLADSSNPNSAKVYLDFSKGVAKVSKDLPKVLQLRNNEQALGMNKFAKPINVLNKGDWLLEILENHTDKLTDFYEVEYCCRISIDRRKELNKIGNKYVFDYVDFYIILDKVNCKYYFVEKEDNSIFDEGLRINLNNTYSYIKFADDDIRNDLEIVKKSEFEPITYGSIKLYNILRDIE